jgi:hypothetical protein
MTTNSKILKFKKKKASFNKSDTKNDQYKIPREDIILESKDDSNKDTDQRNLSIQPLLANTEVKMINNSPEEVARVRKYTEELLSKLEKKGKKIAQERRKKMKEKIIRKNRRKLNLKTRQQKPKATQRKTGMFGPSEEEQLRLELMESESMFKMVARKMDWKAMMSCHRSAHELKMLVHEVENYGDNFYATMDHLELSLMSYFGKEHQESVEMANEAVEEELEHEKDMVDKEEHEEHEKMLNEKEEMLQQEQEKLEMEQRMQRDIEALNHQDEIEDPNKAINKEQLNTVQEQLVTLQEQLGGLQSSVNENEDTKTSLKDQIKNMIPVGLQADSVESMLGNDKELQAKEKKYDETKTALESKISLVQEQVNAMQHQINLMHQKQNKLDLEHDVEDMVDHD